tara:strand:- start:1995 stop:2474 length:480 start_codon:yes stop_codon:yes gene_type:complete
MTKTLILLRGAPGAGKTFIANILDKYSPSIIAVSADDYFYNPAGEYLFIKERVPEAHKWCQEHVDKYLNAAQYDIVIVHNTFTEEWELEPYYEIAEKCYYDTKINSMIVENRKGIDYNDPKIIVKGKLWSPAHHTDNIHGVPKETLDSMKKRLSKSIIL